MMSATDRALLLQLFREEKDSDYPTHSESDFFEVFLPFHFLKQHEIDYSNIEECIVDGAGDGGVDALVFLIDGRISTEVELSSVRKGASLDVYVFSTKFIDSFKTGAIADIRSTLNDLLTLDDDVFETQCPNYNTDLVDAVSEFRSTYKSVVSKFPKLSINVIYATASSSSAGADVLTRLDALKSDLQDQFSDATINVVAADAKIVLSKVRSASEQVRALEVSPHSINLPKGPSYICLSSLSQYARFIKRDGGGIEQRLFDDNVRDWEGDVLVNKDITKTLQNPSDADFWWLNNGISIICDHATLTGSTLMIRNPKIVNGLQTSRQIFSHFSSSDDVSDDRLLLVRVIGAEDESVRADIIRATNRQTPILPAQLLATSEVHKDIELFLRGKGIYYERRKNHWRNLGKKRSEIVSVTDLAQAVIALVIGRPHTARARPGSLLSSETDQQQIFNPEYDLTVYQKAIETVRSVDAQIHDELPGCGLRERNNLKFPVSAKIVYVSCGSVFSVDRFRTNALISPSRRSEIIRRAYEIYLDEGGTDAVAKSEEFWHRVRDISV